MAYSLIPNFNQFLERSKMNSNIKFNGHKTITDFKNSGLKETINDIYNKNLNLLNDIKAINKTILDNPGKNNERQLKLQMDKQMFGSMTLADKAKDTFFNHVSKTIDFMNKATSDVLKLGDNIIKMNDNDILKNAKKMEDLQYNTAVKAEIVQDEMRINFIKSDFRRVTDNGWKIKSIAKNMGTRALKYGRAQSNDFE
jgi:hypothetical protein